MSSSSSDEEDRDAEASEIEFLWYYFRVNHGLEITHYQDLTHYDWWVAIGGDSGSAPRAYQVSVYVNEYGDRLGDVSAIPVNLAHFFSYRPYLELPGGPESVSSDEEQ